MARLVVIVIAIPILIWTFTTVLAREMAGAVWTAWNDCGIEFGQMRHAFKANSFNQKDWK